MDRDDNGLNNNNLATKLQTVYNIFTKINNMVYYLLQFIINIDFI
jgi:hypothetical protein